MTEEVLIPERASGVVLATRMRRFIAAMIDGVISGAIVWLIIIFVLEIPFREVSQLSHIKQVSLGLIGMPVFLILHSLLLHRYGQTIGKRVMNIKIVSTDGEMVSLMKLLLKRYLIQWIIISLPVVGQWINLINILLVFREDRRCGHDLVAGTIVVSC